MRAGRSREEEPVTQPDWSLGSYESTAADLLPAAEQVVSAAQLRRGEHVLDVGCGTGSVALLAARAGARVVAVDPAARLREVARSAADREGLSLDIRAGGAPGLPVDDMTQDAVLSGFARDLLDGSPGGGGRPRARAPARGRSRAQRVGPRWRRRPDDRCRD